jgi:hypothetical protein
MTTSDLIALATARLANLQSLRTSAARLGDVARVIELDAEINETQATLDSLNSIS